MQRIWEAVNNSLGNRYMSDFLRMSVIASVIGLSAGYCGYKMGYADAASAALKISAYVCKQADWEPDICTYFQEELDKPTTGLEKKEG